MRLLLDTHAFIWLAGESHRLPGMVYQAIQDPQNELFLSLVSVWELQIKTQLNKLHLNSPLPIVLAAQQQTNGIQLLSIQLDHILALNNLPHVHSDPFDRLLIAQAQVENLTLATNDTKIQQYNVPLLW